MEATLHCTPFLLLLLTVFCHSGWAEESVASTRLEGQANLDSQDDSLSRTKRGTYKMMRLSRGLQMLRLGKRDPDAFDTEPLPYSDDIQDAVDEATGPKYLIPGLGNPEGVDESLYMAPQLRFAKGDDVIPLEEMSGISGDKRSLAMLRLGKRGDSMLPLSGKRSLHMLRLGKRLQDEKRNLAMLRLGKRPALKRNLHILRLGKRLVDDEHSEGDESKRSLNMLRLGKRAE